jgi:hypothetical protein
MCDRLNISTCEVSISLMNFDYIYVEKTTYLRMRETVFFVRVRVQLMGCNMEPTERLHTPLTYATKCVFSRKSLAFLSQFDGLSSEYLRLFPTVQHWFEVCTTVCLPPLHINYNHTLHACFHVYAYISTSCILMHSPVRKDLRGISVPVAGNSLGTILQTL